MSGPTARVMPPAIYALALAAFAVGTTEFVIVGLIPEMAGDLGVSVATAGLLVSLYAAAITVGTPVFSALTGALPRCQLLLGAMALFALCNVAAAVAPNYATLLAARVVMGVVHGVFFGVGAAVASSLVDESRSGRAQAVMIGGLTVSMIVGVPLGTWLGQLFGWRVPFVVVTALATVSLAALWRLLPAVIPHARPTGFLRQLALLGERRLAVLYAITALGFGSSFVVFTFLSPLLTEVTGLSEAAVGGALVLFGGATVVGNLGGGRLVDALGVRAAMLVILSGLIASLALIPVVAQYPAAMLATLAVWGAFAFAIPPVMQAGVIATARTVAPESIGTASGFTVAAFNLGITGGSLIGGRLLAGPGLLATPYAAVLMALAALVLVAVALPAVGGRAAAARKVRA